MIVYDLKCGKNHRFEVWFKDAATFDTQAASQEIECPFCGDRHIVKAPMAPHIAGKKSEPEPVPAYAAEPESHEARAHEVAQRIIQAMNTMRSQVEENCDNVGNQFADEARKIHYGETEERGIYGEATDDETKELDDEGIDYHRLSWAKPRKN